MNIHKDYHEHEYSNYAPYLVEGCGGNAKSCGVPLAKPQHIFHRTAKVSSTSRENSSKRLCERLVLRLLAPVIVLAGETPVEREVEEWGCVEVASAWLK